jgi:DNA polymerase III subunit epsilon
MNSYIVLDIETTGLDPKCEDILEIGAVKVVNGVIVDEFNQLIRPSKEISDFITNLTGITNAMVVGKSNIDTVLIDFIKFIGDTTCLIGHNIDRFDLPFIQTKVKECDLHLPVEKTIDTVTLAKIAISREVIGSYRLDSLCQHYHIANQARHRAMGDVYATYELFQKHLLSFLNLYKSVEENEVCPKCGTGKMVLRNGMYGAFYGCSQYPKCRHTKKVTQVS